MKKVLYVEKGKNQFVKEICIENLVGSLYLCSGNLNVLQFDG